MINTRLVALIRKEFIQIIRDPRTLMIMFAMPVMMLFLGYSATNDGRCADCHLIERPASGTLAAYRGGLFPHRF